MIAKSTYKSSIIGRSHFHRLIDDDMKAEEIDRYIAEHREDLEADLVEEEILEDE